MCDWLCEESENDKSKDVTNTTTPSFGVCTKESCSHGLSGKLATAWTSMAFFVSVKKYEKE